MKYIIFEMFKSHFFIICFAFIALVNGQSINHKPIKQLEEKSRNYVAYLVKFLSPDTLYPVVLKDKRHIHPNKTYDHTIWYQHHKKSLVEISKFQTGFFGNESSFLDGKLVGNNLLLLKYETHRKILDHYEPIHFFKETSISKDDINYRDDEYEIKDDSLIENIDYINNKFKKIYTLAYYDDLEVLIDDNGMELSVECIVDITLPRFLSTHHKISLENELRSLISFRIKFQNDSNDFLDEKRKEKMNDFTEGSDYLEVYKARAGPFVFKKQDFVNQNVVCELLLKDYDLTNVLRKRKIFRFSNNRRNNSNRNLSFLFNQLISLLFVAFFFNDK
ncbi:hypothetical protein BpHYR1_008158 [Brachionus plicatilis]|uniref:Uncharacterized protein n=1 Tax=Brachionus plicatilis TaxID=10195 RepID=A0A3M7PSK2_BRAPC|nr:hypothetical protein BpHYR1_008158 [Brachionus plicatilis]